MPDGFGARLIYKNSMVIDALQKANLYRRDLNYHVEYATTVSKQRAAVIAPSAISTIPHHSLEDAMHLTVIHPFGDYDRGDKMPDARRAWRQDVRWREIKKSSSARTLARRRPPITMNGSQTSRAK